MKKFLIFQEMKLFNLMLKNSCFLGEVFRVFHHRFFGCFHFFMFSILQVFLGVFLVDYICLLHCFFTVVVVTTSTTDLRERFLLLGVLYVTLLPAFINASLGPAVQSWRLQGFQLWFETQTQPICLFHSAQQKVLLVRFYLCVRSC